MAGIFINYRRDDSPGVAGRLFDYLALKFPRDHLFMDVDAMKPGIDFAEQLDSQVSQCRVLLAVIGPRWLDTRDQAGRRRLDSDKDYVRIELASALKRAIPVIPILVDGATMPPEENLADDLKPLARRHALELRHTRFNSDADAILRALEALVPRRRLTWPLVGAGIAAVIGLAAVAVAWPKLSAKLSGSRPAAVAVTSNPPAPSAPAAALPPAPSPAPAASAAPPTSPSPAAPTSPAPPAPPAVAPSQQAALPPPSPATAAPSASPANDASGLPPGVKLGEMLSGIALRGSVYRVTEIAADPAVCQSACRDEPHCIAWTYSEPPGAGKPAHCSLKPVIPAQSADSCCTSAIERIPAPEMRVAPPVPAGLAGVLPGIELLGGTYTLFGGDRATPEGCQAACRADPQCMAWDYMRPGIGSSDARCFLKNRPSMQVQSPCCVAGFEHEATASPPPAEAAPKAGSGPLFNTNLYGSDYRGIQLSADDWSLCQNACRADNRCLAWTLVRAGVQGPNARCWLKNKIPQPTTAACCTSGIERSEAP